MMNVQLLLLLPAVSLDNHLHCALPCRKRLALLVDKLKDTMRAVCSLAVLLLAPRDAWLNELPAGGLPWVSPMALAGHLEPVQA